MNQKLFVGVVALGLVLVCSAAAYWAFRSPGGLFGGTPPVAGSLSEAPIDVEPSLQVGARVEALSSDGWMPATIQEVDGEQALIRYERAALGEERIDIRMLRKPESELFKASSFKASAAPMAPAASRPPEPSALPITPTAPPLGPRAVRSVAGVPTGTYDCDLDTSGMVREPTGTFADDEAMQWEIGMTLEILSDRDYGAFGGDAARYRFDTETSRIDWEDGVLAGEPAQYDADTGTIVSSMGGQALTCTLRR